MCAYFLTGVTHNNVKIIYMKQLTALSIAFAFVFALNVALVTPAQAQSSSANIATLAETLKSLLAKVADLQKQIAEARGEIKEVRSDVREALNDGLKEGMTHQDIKKIQELLATDKEVYPEGLATGYFGNLTKDALKRFQAKHKLTQSGVLDSQTKDLLEEYLNARFENNKPTGLWRAPGIFKKVQDNICLRARTAWGLFCKDWNDDKDNDEDEDEEEDEDEDETTNYKVKVVVDDGEASVSFTYGGKQYSVVVESVREGRVITALARHMKKSVYKLDKEFVAEVKKKLADAIKNEDMGDEDDADEAIDDATALINEVQDDIDNAEDGVDTEDAQDALDEALELLEEAKEEFDDENYDDAEELAKEALEKAEEAEELLEDAIAAN